MKLLIFLSVLLVPAQAHAVHKYIAFAEKFTSKADNVVFSPSDRIEGTKSLNEYGKTGQRQPSDNTQFIVVRNTAVAIVEISFKNHAEQELYEKMEADGRLFLFQICETVNEGGEIKVKERFSRPIPVDVTKDWTSVEKSTQQGRIP